MAVGPEDDVSRVRHLFRDDPVWPAVEGDQLAGDEIRAAPDTFAEVIEYSVRGPSRDPMMSSSGWPRPNSPIV